MFLAPFWGDLRKREKLSKIKPPLTLFTKKVLISYCVCMYHKQCINMPKTFNLECKITCKITLIPDHKFSILWIRYISVFDKIYFRYQIIHRTTCQKKVKKKIKRSHYFNPGSSVSKKNCCSNRATLCTVNRQGTQLFLSNGQSTLHLRYLTFLVVTFNAAWNAGATVASAS